MFDGVDPFDSDRRDEPEAGWRNRYEPVVVWIALWSVRAFLLFACARIIIR